MPLSLRGLRDLKLEIFDWGGGGAMKRAPETRAVTMVWGNALPEIFEI